MKVYKNRHKLAKGSTTGGTKMVDLFPTIGENFPRLIYYIMTTWPVKLIFLTFPAPPKKKILLNLTRSAIGPLKHKLFFLRERICCPENPVPTPSSAHPSNRWLRFADEHGWLTHVWGEMESELLIARMDGKGSWDSRSASLLFSPDKKDTYIFFNITCFFSSIVVSGHGHWIIRSRIKLRKHINEFTNIPREIVVNANTC